MNVIISNKYKDALSSLNIDVIKKMDGEFDVNTITDTFANFYFNRMILDITAIKDSFNINVIQKLCANLDASKIILFLSDDPRIDNTYLSKIISLGVYNFTTDLSGIIYLMDNPNSYRDVAQYHDLANEDAKKIEEAKTKNVQPQTNIESQNNFGFFQNNNVSSNTNRNVIIGFKDLTPDAGSTTLVYMLKKQLKNRRVIAVEVNSNDFSYFNDSELMSTSDGQIGNIRNRLSQFEIVLMDLNNCGPDVESICNDIVYLLEPSTIKLNKLLRNNMQILDKIKDKKVVLNKSLLTVSDVAEFEYEAKMKIFYNIPPLDERKNQQMVLDSFLAKLGIDTFNNNSNSGGLFDIFRKN